MTDGFDDGETLDKNLGAGGAGVCGDEIVELYWDPIFVEKVALVARDGTDVDNDGVIELDALPKDIVGDIAVDKLVGILLKVVVDPDVATRAK